MIRVRRRAAPARFAATVRQPGVRFLATNQKPTTEEFQQHAYWRKATMDLYKAYEGICAYTCHKIAYDTGWNTVEHFVPKSVDAKLAYEWDNFRLVCGRMNCRKKNHQDVVDPFQLDNGVFVLDFPSLQVRPCNGASDKPQTLAWHSINRLKLNDETCIEARRAYVEPYCRNEITLQYLQTQAPFIYREIVRQHLVGPGICQVMSF